MLVSDSRRECLEYGVLETRVLIGRRQTALSLRSDLEPGAYKMWRPRRAQGILLAVMALISVGPTAAFSGLGITRLRTGAQSSVRRLCAPSRTPLLARDDLADRKASSGGQGQGKLLEFLEFVIGTTFQSPLYVGSSDLHMAVPLPAKDAYPEWFPNWGRLPQAAYDYADRGVEEGWIKRAPADHVFEIKYGVMRLYGLNEKREELGALSDDSPLASRTGELQTLSGRHV